jgi:hypothetical protein
MNEKEIMYNLVVILRHATEAVSMVQNDGSNAPEFTGELERISDSIRTLEDGYGVEPRS